MEAVDRLLNSQPDLEPFEKAQLGSLCCDSAEEAKTLIPSLENKKTDEELQDLLNEVRRPSSFSFFGELVFCADSRLEIRRNEEEEQRKAGNGIRG